MRLRLIAENENDFISPDDLFNSVAEVSFIYDGRLFDAGGKTAHEDIFLQHAKQFPDRYQELSRSWRYNFEKYALLGRIGYDGQIRTYKQIVSFWNEDDSLYDELLRPCLAELESMNFINDDTLVSIPSAGVMSMAQADTVNLSRGPTDKRRQQELELMRQLHLMRPEMKKAAMKELGLIGGGHKPPAQRELEKAGVIHPGQKWWAMYSESR